MRQRECREMREKMGHTVFVAVVAIVILASRWACCQLPPLNGRSFIERRASDEGKWTEIEIDEEVRRKTHSGSKYDKA
jgi:hypothetical protein